MPSEKLCNKYQILPISRIERRAHQKVICQLAFVFRSTSGIAQKLLVRGRQSAAEGRAIPIWCRLLAGLFIAADPLASHALKR